MKTRLTIDLLILLAIILMPWWFYVLAILAALVLIPFYWEGLILATVAQMLFGAAGSGLISLLPVSAFIILVISVPLREELRV